MRPDDEPADPMTALAAGAVACHELYTAYLQAGFSQSEAMQLVIAILVDGVRKLPPPQES